MTPAERHEYPVYGGRLFADFPIPELEGATVSDRDVGCPRWVLSREPAGDPRPAGEPVGEDAVEGEVRVALHRHPDGYDLSYDDTGVFEIRDRGRAIRWRPRSGCSEEAARLDIIGRVLALALHAAGVPTLHASAVDVGGTAIGFVGPKGHGKSTLAFALTERGATLLADDTLPIDLGDPPRALPGVPRLRLWDDSLRAIVRESGGAGELPEAPAGKRMLRHPDRNLPATGVPLRALYLVRPAAPGREEAVRRERLDPVSAALVLVAHAKLGPLLGGPEAPRMMGLATRLCAGVPLYALDVARDLDRLPEAVDLLGRWHGASFRATGAA